jgi:predicted ATP-dependent endonuclease of OLD family
MLQRLAAEQSKSSDDHTSATSNVPNLLLCIEEPELYQHPIRERSFAKVLREIAQGHIPGVANTTQVIYTTHSSHFVGIDRFDHIRVFHKIDNGPGRPRVTRVNQVTREHVVDEIGRAYRPERAEHRYTWEAIRPKLHAIMTPVVNEGFFSDTVVLVEGDEDRGAILGVAHMLGHDLEGTGISVIPCGGKGSIDRPLVIFRQFGIKTFVIWDSDTFEPGGIENNRRLLRLLNEPVVDYPPTQIGRSFACFMDRLQRTMLDEIGERAYSDINQRCHDEQEQHIHASETKNPFLIAHIIQEAANEGLHCQTLEQIVKKILEVKQMDSDDYFASVAGVEPLVEVDNTRLVI